MLEILLIPILGGMALASTAGLIGCFIVWRRLSYFGDTLAHASLLGVTLGALLQMSPTIAIIALCVTVALLLSFLQKSHQLADDTLLGILSHGALAMGLILLTIYPIPGRSLHSLLLGDLVTIQWADLWLILGFSIALFCLTTYFWRPLTSWVINEELAQIEGQPVGLLRIGLMLNIALFIALSMQFVGVLLITALLITPAASARIFTRSPESMACVSITIAVLSTLIGILLAGYLDWPLGPSIVITLTSVFAATFLANLKVK